MADEPVYSARDVARIFGMKESRVLHWARTGIVGPSVKRAGRQYFTFTDLISVRAAMELLDHGVSLQAVRKNVAALRLALPGIERPLARLRVSSDGDRVVVSGGEAPFEPLTRQLVIDFTVASLSEHVASMMTLQSAESAEPAATSTGGRRTAYGWFLEGCSLDGDSDGDGRPGAAAAYAKALELDPGLAAAHTNLGNLAYREGRRGEARDHYTRALTLDAEQPEARFNLGNLLAELDQPAAAMAEWTRVVAGCPEFADAYFNLAATLVRAGGLDPDRASLARSYLARYLVLDDSGEWADEARRLLAGLPNTQ